MSITAAEFKIRFPEFAAESDAKVNLFIADSEVIINEVYWDTKYNLGLYYLTAHYFVLANKTEAGSVASIGAVASRAVDGVSISFSTAIPGNESDAYYASTSYGQRYLTLRRTLGVPVCVI